LSSLSKPNPSRLVLRNLPPFSPVASKLMSLLRRDEVNFKEAAELMRSDVGMAAEVLRLANSPMTGLRYPTTNILQALSVLGINRVASLTTTLCVGKLLKPVAKLPLMRRCWRHNLATALIASQWGDEYKVEPERGYIFGLLAGLGRLALLVSEPNVYPGLADRAYAEGIPLDILEVRFFGFDHRDVGLWLVQEWKLPVELNEVLSITPVVGPNSELAMLIREADKEATRLGFGVLESSPGEPPEAASYEIAERVNQVEQELGV
jgi:HD-like signal output (HDOD) protein